MSEQTQPHAGRKGGEFVEEALVKLPGLCNHGPDLVVYLALTTGTGCRVQQLQLTRCCLESIFQEQAEIFDEICKGEEGLIKWLNPMVHVLFTFSAAFGEGVGLVAMGVMASYDTLASLFESMQGF
ncbi:hypothetical protein EDB87DRAFT_1574611 [Lactarius vividus]|nr:hypothetical protein EDB87DRAFT_1574611 [Lactarius vividus]